MLKTAPTQVTFPPGPIPVTNVGATMKLPPTPLLNAPPPGINVPLSGPLTKAGPKGKRSRVFYRATKGLLSVVGEDETSGIKSPAVILREASCTSKFPSKDAQGTPADSATCINFAYTIVGPNMKGCRLGDKSS
jgi:hypothetical protein